MILYPAIDLINGACVRLAQGKFDQVTLYDPDPFKRLSLFNDEAAQWVHIVDLDGAKAGSPQQHELIGRLAKASKARIQTGGGVRSREHVKTLLDAGVAAVVVGSAAVKNPEEVRGWLKDFGKERITLALDVLPTKDGDFDAALHGWVEGSGISLWDVLDYYPVGVAQRILVTDVSRDGMLMGPNMDLMRALRQKRPDLEIQASGGVKSIDDLYDLKALGVHGAIVGKAIYEGLIDLKAALNVG
ncbi:1-(5-phosphoribosyl)-5-[(5-phosphoribosylamino)methylideneamino]imidazole-4-carboxamide isomerase [Asticcacaulis machinosus]|uniref:1-(5-phosphoribosyl)-5-[(5-phosphoribosylamino)methylideneamino] imidazole-4-carboxamide isomerase n=1 Tax=Asticcacaulis machinosus TaxID=2984211 RepID=A0ABT5HMX4_9CAUL|nr:1-(5-phosphoribosyl)-5-[(5-phosphoribosylamino)methylideneamino]imidazole-4-carboxamide isomerase [Asticcacaulis machinosus]MDC7677601.1 1-(5-phosphoribosyl)-5-[(5-phosphoribosylamino)methylideneamino]imidazole-4-carboxamide isomerase [Asticcacaulis machinosus]